MQQSEQVFESPGGVFPGQVLSNVELYGKAKPEDREGGEENTKGGNEGVVPPDVDFVGAFARFRGAEIEASSHDFSDSVAHATRAYTAGKGDKAGNIAKKETLAQRYARLQREVAELASDVSKSKGKGKKSKEGAGEGAGDVVPLDSVEALENQLKQLTTDSPVAGSVLPSQMLSELVAAASRSAKQGGEKDSSVTYELCFAPDVGADATRASQIAALESRLAALETDVGESAGTSGAVLPDLAAAGTLDLMAQVAQLRERMGVLDAQGLSGLEEQIERATKSLHVLAEENSGLGEDNIGVQVADAYNTLRKWDKLMQQVPLLVERLRALRSIHESANGLSQSVDVIREQQREIKELIEDAQKDAAALTEIQQRNTETMASNITVLERRMSELSASIAAIGEQTF